MGPAILEKVKLGVCFFSTDSTMVRVSILLSIVNWGAYITFLFRLSHMFFGPLSLKSFTLLQCFPENKTLSYNLLPQKGH
ncbi:hypothetical protein GDO78_020748 [Eleutherodactylus coqui]|uniref:Uncharacterized protein n=1 Tax=Eleutherodactylus coqui TaxID=57060 RepID=A0A8J6BIG0_ELECQ|nr:hypothetical protein GDO78_020748 [Eleutherodactylus coqui]